MTAFACCVCGGAADGPTSAHFLRVLRFCRFHSEAFHDEANIAWLRRAPSSLVLEQRLARWVEVARETHAFALLGGAA